MDGSRLPHSALIWGAKAALRIRSPKTTVISSVTLACESPYLEVIQVDFFVSVTPKSAVVEERQRVSSWGNAVHHVKVGH